MSDKAREKLDPVDLQLRQAYGIGMLSGTDVVILGTPAAVHFLSVEPLLGDVDLAPYYDLDGIQWVIVGGESGPGARPMDLVWVERIIVNAHHADVPVFVKQLGSVWARENGATDRKGGDPDEWPEYLRVREYPA